MSWLPGTHGRVPGRGHAHREPQHVGRVRAAVDQVADEHRAAGRRGGRDAVRRRVAERRQQRHQLVAAAVDVADDVERPGLGAPVGPHRHAHDLGRLDVLDRLSTQT